MNYGVEIARIFFYLLIVLAIIYLGQRYLRRFMRGQQQGEHIQIIEQLYLSPKKNLTLVRAKDRVILLAVHEEGVEELDSWPGEEFGPEQPADVRGGEPGSFGGRLKKWLETYRRDYDE